MSTPPDEVSVAKLGHDIACGNEQASAGGRTRARAVLRLPSPTSPTYSPRQDHLAARALAVAVDLPDQELQPLS
jgi:hypothetical protein